MTNMPKYNPCSKEFQEEAKRLGLTGYQYYRKLVEEGKLPNPTDIDRKKVQGTIKRSGCKSDTEYCKLLITRRGFKSLHEYNEYLAKKRGFKSRNEYYKYLIKKRGFKSPFEYQTYLAKNKGFKSVYEYRDHLAKIRGFASYSEYIKHFYKEKKCCRCGKRIPLSIDDYHHIIPRKFEGIDSRINRIPLCYECHDYVEFMTEEWIKSGMRHDIDILRLLIVNDGFPDDNPKNIEEIK